MSRAYTWRAMYLSLGLILASPKKKVLTVFALGMFVYYCYQQNETLTKSRMHLCGLTLLNQQDVF